MIVSMKFLNILLRLVQPYRAKSAAKPPRPAKANDLSAHLKKDVAIGEGKL